MPNYVGKTLSFALAVTDVSSGDAVDADTLVCTVTRPPGTEDEYTYGTDAEITRSAVGTYRFRYTPSVVGDLVLAVTVTKDGNTGIDVYPPAGTTFRVLPLT